MQEVLLFVQQHTALVFIGVIVLFLLTIVEFIRIKRNNNHLTPAKAVQLINHQNAVIVDLRQADLFTKGHIVEAISIPFKDFQSKYKKLEKHKTQPIMLVCTTGTESAQAAVTLAKEGYNTFVLAGGIRAWQMAEMPLIKG